MHHFLSFFANLFEKVKLLVLFLIAKITKMLILSNLAHKDKSFQSNFDI